MTAVLEIRELSKRFGGRVAVDALSLEVREGEIVGLLGANGAGKTTTLRLLMGLLRPDAGTASVLGRDCFEDGTEVKRHVGYLPDVPAFHDDLRGREILRFWGAMHGIPRPEAERRIEALAARLGLEEVLDIFVAACSHGMRKKLGLALALLHEPALLLLDEPSSGLDPHGTRTMQELLRERSGAGCAVLLSSHLLDQVERVGDRVAILHRGRIAAQGPLADLRRELRTGGGLEEVFFAVTEAPAAPETP